MKKGIFTAIVLTAILGAIAVPFTWIRAWRTELTLDGHPVTMPASIETGPETFWSICVPSLDTCTSSESQTPPSAFQMGLS